MISDTYGVALNFLTLTSPITRGIMGLIRNEICDFDHRGVMCDAGLSGRNEGSLKMVKEPSSALR